MWLGDEWPQVVSVKQKKRITWVLCLSHLWSIVCVLTYHFYYCSPKRLETKILTARAGLCLLLSMCSCTHTHKRSEHRGD